MISRELIDLLNSGDAVSIIGSGISVEAGVPSWMSLFTSIADALDGEGFDTSTARVAAEKDRLPEAFDLLAALTSRPVIHARISALVDRVVSSGRHHSRLADWPFRFHITTNYDPLIERASGGQLVAVGNRGRELPKLASGVRDIVWHIHGMSGLSDDISQLVVTKSDYDDYYPASNMVERLKALTTAYRCVFVGFGFNDEDFTHVLKAVGRIAHSGKPSFAFIGYGASSNIQQSLDELRAAYNVEVIPYTKRGDDHSDLHRVLESYTPFVVRRSMSFGRAVHATPEYDPLTSSLRIQSSLDIGELAAMNPSLRSALVGARVLAHIREHPGGHDESLAPIYKSGEPGRLEVLDCVVSLRERGIVTPAPALEITEDYRKRTEAFAATVELASEQFRGSLLKRLRERSSDLDEPAQGRAVSAVSAFLVELCRERGLGVAQNLATSDANQAARRTVSLVQGLPSHLTACSTRNEAIAAVHLGADVLTRPRGAEARFLGLLSQAYFGQHLVGASERLAKVDLDLIADTCYVLDASVLVCLLAEYGDIHEFTVSLVTDLVASGAVLTTTDLFVDEIEEHARWAFRLVDRYGEQSQEVIDALCGRGGYRPNQFLGGYFLGTPPDPSFLAYFARVLGMNKKEPITSMVVRNRLKAFGIQALQLDQWVGFNQDFLIQREKVQEEIADRRTRQGTFKHERQAKAEAEVALIVDGVRRDTLQPPGTKAKDAFFLSSTRVVDRLPNLERRICLLPEGLAQWLWSSQTISPRHAELVFEQLLWDLAQGGVEFVDRSTLLRRFSGVVEAAETDLRTALRDRREYLVQRYGPNPDQAFSDADPLDFPRLASEVQQEVIERMEQEVIAAKQREQAARANARISEKDRAELAMLRGHQKENRRKAQKRRRAAQSRKRTKGGHRKKK